MNAHGSMLSSDHMDVHMYTNPKHPFVRAGNTGLAGLNVDQLPEPDFTEPIENITVPVGREAILSCSVQNLGGYKVGWMRVSDQTVLALQGRVVTHNARYSVVHEDMRTWRLKIRQLRESDRGCYMCQINAIPMKKQLGCIDVYVPPDINDDESSSDVTVREGEDATLFCSANGHPPPRITWRREDGSPLLIRRNKTVARVDSYYDNLLNLSDVDRKQMGAYLCIAANDVPPAVSKRVFLNVHFSPQIVTPRSLFGGLAESDVDLECMIQASPISVNYWIKGSAPKRNSYESFIRPEMLLDGKKHYISEEKLSPYEFRLKLVVRNFSRSDLGIYTCISTNSLGRANGTIRIYEIKIPTSTSTTSTTSTTTHMPTTILRSTITSSTKIATAEVFITETTTPEYPTFFPVHGDPYGGQMEANQHLHDIMYSRGDDTGAGTPMLVVHCIVAAVMLQALLIAIR
ncbi:Immunoglobulin-like domain [Sergentomyia squamirostris]